MKKLFRDIFNTIKSSETSFVVRLLCSSVLSALLLFLTLFSVCAVGIVILFLDTFAATTSFYKTIAIIVVFIPVLYTIAMELYFWSVSRNELYEVDENEIEEIEVDK